MQPFDLVAARLMNQPVVGGVPQLYAGPVDCCLKVLRSEGPQGLFKGCVANYARAQGWPRGTPLPLQQ